MAFIRANTSGGGGGYTEYDVISSYDVTGEYTKSHTISNKMGAKVIVLLYDWGSSDQAYNTFDGATCSGGTITKLCNFASANAKAIGTFYQADITSNTFTIEKSSHNSCMCVFEAV